MDYNEITNAICDEAISKSTFYNELNIIASQRDKLKFINKLIEKYNCDFDDANIVCEYFIDKKPLPSMSPHKQDYNNQIAQNLSNKPKCIYCNSTNIKKISTMSKAGSAALFGVFAMGKISKQWHCNNCKSDF